MALPPDAPPGSDFWLAQSEGFRVDGPDGRVGVVCGVMPGALLVSAGLFRLSLSVVSLSEVASVEPRRRRIVLRAA